MKVNIELLTVCNFELSDNSVSKSLFDIFWPEHHSTQLPRVKSRHRCCKGVSACDSACHWTEKTAAVFYIQSHKTESHASNPFQPEYLLTPVSYFPSIIPNFGSKYIVKWQLKNWPIKKAIFETSLFDFSG